MTVWYLQMIKEETMSYILKTHNKKVVSGSKVKAKIVSSGDKSSFTNAYYDIVIQPAKLSDRECVIRDKQTVDSIISASNDFSHITEQVADIQKAINSARYGSRITYNNNSWDNLQYRTTENGVDKILDIMDANGKVIQRPPYNPEIPDAASRNHIITLTIKFKKGDYEDELKKEVIVPMYTAEEVLTALQSNTTTAQLWDAVKLDNLGSSKQIHSAIKVNFSPNEIRSKFFNTPEMRKYIVASDKATPSLTVDITNIYGLASDGSMTRTDAKKAWNNGKSNLFKTDSILTSQDDRNGKGTLYKLTNKETDLDTKYNTLLGYTISKVAGMDGKIDFKFQYTKADTGDNEIATQVSTNHYKDALSLTQCSTISSFITATMVSDLLKNNITNKWFDLDKIGNKNGVEERMSGTSNDSISDPYLITIGASENVIFRIPANILTLIKNGSVINPSEKDTTALDPESFGYYAFKNGSQEIIHGFDSTNGIYFGVDMLTSSAHMYTTDQASAEGNRDDVNAISTGLALGTQYTNTTASDTYILIKNSDIGDSGITGHFTITIPGAAYGTKTVSFEKYFKISKAASTSGSSTPGSGNP